MMAGIDGKLGENDAAAGNAIDPHLGRRGLRLVERDTELRNERLELTGARRGVGRSIRVLGLGSLNDGPVGSPRGGDRPGRVVTEREVHERAVRRIEPPCQRPPRACTRLADLLAS